MATITTRSGKGSPLTNTEVDNNFTNLNTAKYESGDNASLSALTITSGGGLNYTQGDIKIKSATSDNPEGRGQGLFLFNEGQDRTWYAGTLYGSGAAYGIGFKDGASLQEASAHNENSMFVLYSSANGAVFNENSSDRDFRIESNDSSAMFFVDGADNAVGVGTNAPLGRFNQTASYQWFDTTSTFVTVDGGDKEANINLQATGDENHHQVGGLWFTNKNGQSDAHRQIAGVSARTVNGNSIAGGDLQIWTKIANAGATVPITTFRHDGLFINEKGAIFNESGASSDFRVESDNNSNLFLVDAGDDRVRINYGGTQSTGDVFTVTGASSLNGYRIIRGQSWGSWAANTSYYVFTMNPSGNGSSAGANVEIFATGATVSASFRVVCRNQSNTTNAYAYCTGTNTNGLELVGYRDNSDARFVHFYVRPTSSYGYTNRVSITGAGSIVFDPSAPSAPVDEDYVWTSEKMYARRLLSGTGMDVTSAYDTTISLTDGRTASPASIKYKSFIGWDHYHGRSLTFGMEHNDYSLSNRRALLKFNNTSSDVEGHERLTVTGASTIFNEESLDVDFRVEGNNQTHVLFVDGQQDAVVINGATYKGAFTTWMNSSTDQEAYFSTANQADNGHADGYAASGVMISGRANTTSGDQQTVYLSMHNASPDTGPNGHGTSSYITLTTPGSQGTYGRGEFNFYIRNSAPYTFPNNPETNPQYWMNSLFRIQSAGEVAVNPAGSASGDFRVESDSQSNMFLVDANTNRVGVKTASPSTDFHVEGSQYTMANISAGHKGRNAQMYGINLGSNPEGKFVHHPYLHNDCANSVARGNATINGLSGYSGANYPFQPDGLFMSFANSQVNGSDPEGVDSGYYWYYEVIPNKTMSYGRNWFINFGNTGWAPQHVKIREYVSGVWRKVYDSNTSGTNGAEAHWSPGYNSAAGPTKVQFICSDDAPSNSQRVNHIGGYNYSSDGMRGYFVSATGSGLIGNLNMSSGKGIDFSAVNGVAANTAENILDDYEEGEWNPTIYGQSTAGTMTQPNSSYQSAPIGYYTKIGNRVFMNAVLRGVGLSSASGFLRMGGFPYTFTRIAGVSTYLEGFDPRYNKSLGGSYPTNGIILRGSGTSAAFGPAHSYQWDVYLDASNTLWNGGGNGVHGSFTIIGYI